MDNPIQDLAGHLLFSRHGAVWATWRLQGLPYGRRPGKDKEEARALHQMLFRSLGGESLLMGLEVDSDPVDVVQRMLLGLPRPLDELPEWALECESTLDRLGSDLPLGERTYWLAVPLRNVGSVQISEPLRRAHIDLLNRVGVPRRAPGRRLLRERMLQAAQVQAMIPAPFRPRPATPAEQVWVFQHAQHRAGVNDPWLPTPPDAAAVDAQLSLGVDTDRNGTAPDQVADADSQDATDLGVLQAWQSPGRIGRPLLDEGALTDKTGKAWRERARQLKPSQRRVLKVIDPDLDDAATYQSLAVLAGTPTGGAVFPGTEWLGNAENSGVPLDWAVRMRNNAREAVIARNQRAVRNLNDQYEQREGEVSTGHHELDAVRDLLTEYQARLATDRLEVELETLTFFATSAATRDDALAQGSALARWFAGLDHPLERPLGQQEQAWWAMLPGTPWPVAFKDLTQISTSEGFSAAVPLVSSVLGDGRGIPFAENQTTLATSIVMLDLFSTILADFSGAFAVCGELGAGKTFAMKSLAGAIVDRGGALVAIDRSGVGEWAHFARSLGESTVLDVTSPDWSLDPLRMFAGGEAARVTQTLLTALLSIDVGTSADTTLGVVTREDYRARHHLSSLPRLADHLLTACDMEGATELGRKMQAFRSRDDFAGVLFDETLPPLPLLETRALIFRTQGTAQPSRLELTEEHLFKRLSVEKLFGRAIYAHLMGLARRRAFADPGELVVFAVDECHHVTASIEGEAELELFVREGRKEGAAAILGSQDCGNDFGSGTLQGLIPYRLVMRLTDQRLATAAVEWVGLEVTTEHVGEVMKDLSPRDETDPDGLVPPARRGEGIFRDAHGRLGRVRVLGPAREVRRRAYSSTPTATTGAGTVRGTLPAGASSPRLLLDKSTTSSVGTTSSSSAAASLRKSTPATTVTSRAAGPDLPDQSCPPAAAATSARASKASSTSAPRTTRARKSAAATTRTEPRATSPKTSAAKTTRAKTSTPSTGGLLPVAEPVLEEGTS